MDSPCHQLYNRTFTQQMLVKVWNEAAGPQKPVRTARWRTQVLACSLSQAAPNFFNLQLWLAPLVISYSISVTYYLCRRNDVGGFFLYKAVFYWATSFERVGEFYLSPNLAPTWTIKSLFFYRHRGSWNRGCLALNTDIISVFELDGWSYDVK